MILAVTCKTDVFFKNPGIEFLSSQAPFFFFAQPGALMVIGLVDGVGLSLLPCDWPSGGRGVIGSAGEEHPL